MRLERVRRHVRVVAPDMLEQSLAGHWLLFGAMEITQDRRFFLGQPQFDPLRVDEVLRSWPKGVRSDLKLRILAGFILPQLRADSSQQHDESERLADIIVGAGIEARHGVSVGIVRGEHDDGPPIPVSPHSFDRLAPIKIGQPDIHDDEVGRRACDGLKRRFRRLDRLDLKLRMQSQLLDQRMTQVSVIVYDQQLSRLAHQLYSTRRIARRQVKSALQKLGRKATSDRAVHSARKELKKARATLRLLRDALGRSTYKKENAALRDAARPLSEVRDGRVLLDALNSMVEYYGAPAAALPLTNFKRALSRRRTELRHKILEERGPLRAARKALRDIRSRSEKWHVGRHGGGSSLEPWQN